MRLAIALLAFEIFIELTQPGGNKIWIEESHITLLRGNHLGSCTGHTVIVTGTQNLCVMESPDEVRRKIEETKK
jgi:hypothetical protein